MRRLCGGLRQWKVGIGKLGDRVSCDLSGRGGVFVADIAMNSPLPVDPLPDANVLSVVNRFAIRGGDEEQAGLERPVAVLLDLERGERCLPAGAAHIFAPLGFDRGPAFDDGTIFPEELRILGILCGQRGCIAAQMGGFELLIGGLDRGSCADLFLLRKGTESEEGESQGKPKLVFHSCILEGGQAL